MFAFHFDQFLSSHVFAFLFLFSRLGCVIMLLPGIGESYVPARTRMAIALCISFILMEPMLPHLPPPPDNIADMVKLLGYEIIIGLFFGTYLRLLMSCLETIGFVVALQTGLSNATILNPALATQSPLSSAFLAIVGLTLIFTTGLDHMLIQSIVQLYDAFPPGGELMPGDMAQVMIRMTNKCFVTGIEIAMPFFVMGLLLFIGLGMLQKLMPQVQLFLVVLPVQIWGGLTLLSLTIASMMMLWLQFFDQSVRSFFGH